MWAKGLGVKCAKYNSKNTDVQFEKLRQAEITGYSKSEFAQTLIEEMCIGQLKYECANYIH
jgi:hypothetical protein